MLLGESLGAQVWIPSGSEMRRPSALQFDSGVSSFKGDFYGYVAPNFTYNHNSRFGYSFSLPITALAIDRNPLQENSRPGKVREFEYNSTQDYSRVLNYLSYGIYNQQVPGKITYSFYAGRLLDGHIGHGTIVNKYMSNLRLDAYNPGVMADINTDYGGVQYFSNSVVGFEVNAIRLYIKPLAIGQKAMRIWSEEKLVLLANRGKVIDEAGRPSVVDEVSIEKKEKTKGIIRPMSKDSRMELIDNDPWTNRLTLGFTNASDRNAPKFLEFNSNGSPVTALNKDNPQVKEAKRITIEGFDAEYRLINLPFLEIAPYIDINRIRDFDRARGTHAGLMLRIGNKDLNVILKPEHRTMSSNYIPMYFDSFYEIERFQTFPPIAPMRTKYDTLANLQSNSTLRGYYHTVYVNVYHFGFELALEDYTGKNNSRVYFASYLPIGSSFIVSFYYTKKGFDSRGDAFRVDNNSTLAGEVSKNFGPLILRVQNLRRFLLDQPEKSFRPEDEIRFLVSGGISF